MPPQIASLVFLAAVVGLFYLDRDAEGETKTSPALWIPIVWLAIGGSRNISEWLGASSAVTSPDQYLEGSPLDRVFLTALLAVGLGVLVARAERTRDILIRNAPLLVFLLYCAASATWSDFPFVTFKRWSKTLGNVTMVLIVLTDPNVASAIKRFVTRVAFLLIPASMLLIKYYPALGRYYDRWEGTAFYGGVTTDKNMLGNICMVLGLAIVWRLVDLLRNKSDKGRRRRLVAFGILLAINIWLFYLMNSATSLACLVIGGTVIVFVGLLRFDRPVFMHALVAGIATVGLVAFLYRDAFAFLVGSLGRNTSLTGRTDLWNDVLQLDTSPWLGAGFESFFLGSRLDVLWSKYWWHPNEAHNGYLDIYLTLGRVGLFLMALLFIYGYHNATRQLRSSRSASLRLAFLIVAPIYSFTEAPFKVTGPLWILFLFAVTAVPPEQEEVSAVAASDLSVLPRDAEPAVPRSSFTPKESIGHWLRPSQMGGHRRGRFVGKNAHIR